MKKKCPICGEKCEVLGNVSPINVVMCMECFRFVYIGKHFDGKYIDGSICFNTYVGEIK